MKKGKKQARRVVVRPGACWPWIGYKNHKGYGRMMVRIGNKFASRNAHRVSYELFVGQIPDGAIICHECDNPSCVNPEHLFLGTPLANTQDMLLKGRCRSGRKKKGRKGMKRRTKHGRRLRSMVELAEEIGKGRDVVIRGEVRKNKVLKSLRWDFLADLVLSGEAFRLERRKSA